MLERRIGRLESIHFCFTHEVFWSTQTSPPLCQRRGGEVNSQYIHRVNVDPPAGRNVQLVQQYQRIGRLRHDVPVVDVIDAAKEGGRWADQLGRGQGYFINTLVQQLGTPGPVDDVTDEDIERAIAEIQDAIRKVPR